MLPAAKAVKPRMLEGTAADCNLFRYQTTLRSDEFRNRLTTLKTKKKLHQSGHYPCTQMKVRTFLTVLTFLHESSCKIN
jgi:hypothetical protein